jgi:ankyrin repeat protein
MIVLLFQALHYGCEEGYVEICKLLVESGGKLDVANRDGQTPMELAKPEVARVINQIRI